MIRIQDHDARQKEQQARSRSALANKEARDAARKREDNQRAAQVIEAAKQAAGGFTYPDPGLVNYMDATGEQQAALLERAARFAEFAQRLWGPTWKSLLGPCWIKHEDVVHIVSTMERTWHHFHTPPKDPKREARLDGPLDALRKIRQGEELLRHTTLEQCKAGHQPRLPSPVTVTEQRREHYEHAGVDRAAYTGVTWPATDDTGRQWSMPAECADLDEVVRTFDLGALAQAGERT